MLPICMQCYLPASFLTYTACVVVAVRFVTCVWLWVHVQLRSKMQQQWNKGQQHFESDEAFNKALEAAVKGNMDKLLSQDVSLMAWMSFKTSPRTYRRTL